MADHNKDKLQGNVEKFTGKVKEELGDMTDNDSMEREGKMDQVKGHGRDALGEVKEAFHDAGKTISHDDHRETRDHNPNR